jgi:hypothetical protein
VCLLQSKLVQNVWQFAAMYKIWRTHPSSTATALYYRGSSKGTARLPPSVQEEMRRIAKNAMVSLEGQILHELDQCMVQGKPLRVEEKPVIWACLWVLLWCYRSLLMELVAFCRMIEKLPSRESKERERKTSVKLTIFSYSPATLPQRPTVPQGDGGTLRRAHFFLCGLL